jgi:two-component system, cell cycle sensor histidine kinase and response regulator CckA
VQDKAPTELAPASGDFRAGAFVLTSGFLLAGSLLAGFWAGSAVIPTGILAALTVSGGFLLAGRSGLLDGSRARRASGIDHFHGCPEPVFVSDLAGRTIARNPAAGALGDPLAAWVADPAAVRYRLTREARATGVGAEAVGDGGRCVVVVRHGRRRLLWRIERTMASATALPEAAVPALRLDAEGAVVATNAALDALLATTPKRVEEVLADAPLRPDGMHVLAATGQVVRAVVMPGTGGLRDVLLIPLDVAEVAGLVPDQFLEDLPVALARLSTDGTVTFANKAARQLLGEAVTPGINIADLIEGMGRSINERLQDTTRGRALGRAEIARGSVDGAEIYLQVAFTRTILDGAPSLLAVLSDATELKTLEAQFVQSQKMQAVGQLAGGVAHDFNNLLTAINGHCDLLLMRHDVADVEHGDLMQIRQNANRAAALVKQLLAFSRKQTLRPTVINLQDTLSELMHLLNRLLTDKVTLRIEHGADLAPVRVDERQLEQVIMNLVVNARDAMPRGGEVRITTRNLHLEADMHRDRAVILPGDYVVIEVADSGHGIPRASSTRSSSRSTPPSRSARAPGSAFRRPTASSSRPAASSSPRARRGRVRSSRSCCRPMTRSSCPRRPSPSRASRAT